MKEKLRLDQFLKWHGIAPTGGQAKLLIQEGEVRLNGEVCLLRGKGLEAGDVVEALGHRLVVLGEDLDRRGSR